MDGRRFVHEYRQRPGPHAPLLVLIGAGYVARRAAAREAAGSRISHLLLTSQERLTTVEALIGTLIPHIPIASA